MTYETAADAKEHEKASENIVGIDSSGRELPEGKAILIYSNNVVNTVDTAETATLSSDFFISENGRALLLDSAGLEICLQAEVEFYRAPQRLQKDAKLDLPTFNSGKIYQVEENDVFIEGKAGKATWTNIHIDPTLNRIGTFYGIQEKYNYMVIEMEDCRYIQFFRFKNLPNESLTVFAEKRIETAEEACEKLQKDFPWMSIEEMKLEPDGLTSRNLLVPKIVSSHARRLNIIDSTRLEHLYRSHAGNIEEINPAEKLYIGMRQYARMCEFSFVAKHWEEIMKIENVEERKEYIKREVGNKSSNERYLEVLGFSERVDQELWRIQDTRFALEEKLFGRALPTHYYTLHQRFVSQDSIDFTDSIGQYFRKAFTTNITSFLSDPSWKYYTDMLEQKPESIENGIIKFIAQTHSHETDHGGRNELVEKLAGELGDLDPLNSPKLPEEYETLKWEEAWVDWKSTILTSSSYYKSTYQYKVGYSGETGKAYLTDEDGGALLIQKMVQECVAKCTENAKDLKVNGKKFSISADDVMRSALATANTRKDWGIYKVEGVEVIGFRQLYNLMFQNSESPHTFENNMIGSSDEDYWKARRDKALIEKDTTSFQDLVTAYEEALPENNTITSMYKLAEIVRNKIQL